MSFIKKIKQKILDKSDTYNYYKSENSVENLEQEKTKQNEVKKSSKKNNRKNKFYI